MAFWACLALPVALLHARAAADMLIVAIDLLFLARSWRAGNWVWVQQPFVVAAGAWWVWLVVCSVLGTGGLVLAVVVVRLPLLAVALGDWALAGSARRQSAVWAMLAAAAAWLALECWEQVLTGTNLFGHGRYIAGELTGPFAKPRAGPALILIFFPVLVPAVLGLAGRPALLPRMAGVALAVAMVATMVMIGQRMPTALMVLGFAVCALLVPRLRVAAGCAVGAGVALVGVLPWVSPASFGKLVGQTAGQLAHFGQSDYGLIFVRAVTVWEPHPWLGLGFDGFRRGCGAPGAMHGVAWLGVATARLNGGMAACNIHPHNYYLEALDSSGVPGAMLFALMAAAALWRLGAGMRGQAQRIGAFVAALVAFWPVATTSAFASLPNAGWVFLVMGLGFAADGDAPRGERGRLHSV